MNKYGKYTLVVFVILISLLRFNMYQNITKCIIEEHRISDNILSYSNNRSEDSLNKENSKTDAVFKKKNDSIDQFLFEMLDVSSNEIFLMGFFEFSGLFLDIDYGYISPG